MPLSLGTAPAVDLDSLPPWWQGSAEQGLRQSPSEGHHQGRSPGIKALGTVHGPGQGEQDHVVGAD